MVQTFINEVRRCRTEQNNNNLQEIQRLWLNSSCGNIGGSPYTTQATPAGCGVIDTRIGELLVFPGDENTWGDWSFKLHSNVSVVDLQLGRMMEAAELAAHARTRTADHPAATKRSTGIPPPFSKVQSAFASTTAQLQEPMHFDVGQEPAGGTDRLIVLEGLVGQYENFKW